MQKSIKEDIKLLIGTDVYVLPPNSKTFSFKEPVRETVGSSDLVRKGYWVRKESDGSPGFVSYKLWTRFAEAYEQQALKPKVAPVVPAPVSSFDEMMKLVKAQVDQQLEQRVKEEIAKLNVKPVVSTPVAAAVKPVLTATLEENLLKIGTKVFGTIYSGEDVPGVVECYDKNHKNRFDERQPFGVRTTQGKLMWFDARDLRKR